MLIVYLDTGFFIDFFSRRSLVAVTLRTSGRRGRDIQQIKQDSNSIMNKLGRHEAITSVITMLEYKDTTYCTLRKIFANLPDITIENIIRTKSEAAAFYERCKRNKITLIPLESHILEKAITSTDYNGLEINDAIHVHTARSNGASLIISADSDLLKFDKRFGDIRIVDSDEAVSLL